MFKTDIKKKKRDVQNKKEIILITTQRIRYFFQKSITN